MCYSNATVHRLNSQGDIIHNVIDRYFTDSIRANSGKLEDYGALLIELAEAGHRIGIVGYDEALDMLLDMYPMNAG